MVGDKGQLQEHNAGVRHCLRAWRSYKVQLVTEAFPMQGKLPQPRCSRAPSTGTRAARRSRARRWAPRLQAAGLVARRDGLAARLVQRGRLLRRCALRLAGLAPGGAERGSCLRRRTPGSLGRMRLAYLTAASLGTPGLPVCVASLGSAGGCFMRAVPGTLPVHRRSQPCLIARAQCW
jgi:hypothetical protein